MTTINVAESAFVNAVVKALKAQDEMLQLRMKLVQIDTEAQRANEAALKEVGLTEDSDFEELMDAQEKWLRQAIQRSGLPSNHPVIKATENQIKQARVEYAKAMTEEASMLGKIRGPEV